jgi:hypothetical protein
VTARGDGMSHRTDACRVCGHEAAFLFEGSLLGRRVAYFECARCRYVQTESPTWLEAAYAEAINRSDTGILMRNERNARMVIRMLALLGALHGRVVDCAGGYGLLVRMLRDRGVQALWQDRYCDNLVARGFEATDDTPADLVTAFEALEHFVDPPGELQRLFERAPNVLVSTDLIPAPAPRPGQWWYYAPEHGQHIGFYRVETLRHLAVRFGRHLHTDGKSFHLFTAQPLPAWRWKLARRTSRLAPLIARVRLRTLVWQDHAQAAGRPAE